VQIEFLEQSQLANLRRDATIKLVPVQEELGCRQKEETSRESERSYAAPQIERKKRYLLSPVHFVKVEGTLPVN
jgi:hypothetical protein